MQDFTTFTEVDAPGRLVVIAARSTFMALRGDDADVYLYKNIVDSWPVNFRQEFEFYIDAADPTGADRSAALVSYVANLDSWDNNLVGNQSQISVMVESVAAGPIPNIALVETSAGVVYTSLSYAATMDTLYYCTLVKIGTEVTLYIYTDAARTVLVDTLVLVLQGAWTITYVMAPQSNGGAGVDEISGYIQDMDDPLSSEDLYASFTVKQWYADLYGHAIIRNIGSAELYGHGIIEKASSAELYGHVIIRNIGSAELYGHGIIRNIGSIELYGHGIIVNFVSVELYGHGIIRNVSSAELYGHGIVINIGSAELYSHAVIRHTGIPLDLYGHGIIRHESSAELYGHAIIRNIGSAEEYGHVIIRNIGSADLVCRFRISTDDWIVQGVSAEAYIELSIVV